MPTASGTEEASDASTSRTSVHAPAAGPAWAILPRDARLVERRLDLQGPGLTVASLTRVFDLWPGRSAETGAWTFGLEFEFASADAGWVASELHARGLVSSPEPAAYHSPRMPGKWSVEHDSSVTTVFRHDGDSDPETSAIAIGGEVVSPPFVDSPEAWAQVATVLEVLRACGAEMSGQCGFHVHFGASALRDDVSGAEADLSGAHRFVRRVTRLAVLANACFEDVLFRMASAEGGRHRGRPFFYRHSRPLEQPLGTHYGTIEELAQSLGKPGAPRRAALNLTNVGTPDKDTVEFRQSNGTLDGRVVQAFVRLCAMLVGAARWSPDAVRETPEPLGSHVDDEPDDESAASLWRMTAAACPDGVPFDVATSLLWLFRRGRWQPGIADLARGW